MHLIFNVRAEQLTGGICVVVDVSKIEKSSISSLCVLHSGPFVGRWPELPENLLGHQLLLKQLISDKIK